MEVSDVCDSSKRYFWTWCLHDLANYRNMQSYRQGENCVSEVAFHKMGEVVFGTVMKLRALISLNLEGYTPISYKSGRIPIFVALQ